MIKQIHTSVITCKNCSAEIELDYCPACGQKKVDQRLTLKKVYIEFIHDYLGFDKGIFYTTKNLLLRPGYAVNEYLAGRRKPYLKPLQYYLITLTLYFVISTLFNIDLMQLGQDITKDTGMNTSYSPKMQQKVQYYNELLGSNLKVISTLMIPLLTLALLMVYRKKKYNSAELLVFSLYVYGLSFVFYSTQNLLLALPLSAMVSKALFYTIFLIAHIYIIFAIQQFFSSRSWLGVVKAIWALVLSYIAYILLVTAVWILIYAF